MIEQGPESAQPGRGGDALPVVRGRPWVRPRPGIDATGRQPSRRATAVDVVLAAGSVIAVLQSAELAYLALPGVHPLPGVAWAGMGAQVLCFFVVVPVTRRHWRGRNGAALSIVAERRPVLARRLIAVVVLVSLGALVATVVTDHLPDALSAGEPVAEGGRYFLDDHGGRIPISLHQYRQAVQADQQSFMAFTLLFFLVSVANVVMVVQRAKWSGTPKIYGAEEGT